MPVRLFRPGQDSKTQPGLHSVKSRGKKSILSVSGGLNRFWRFNLPAFWPSIVNAIPSIPKNVIFNIKQERNSPDRSSQAGFGLLFLNRAALPSTATWIGMIGLMSDVLLAFRSIFDDRRLRSERPCRLRLVDIVGI